MEISKKTLRRVFFMVIGCIVLYWILHETERVKFWFSNFYGMIAPFIIGAVIAFILNVPMRAFEGLLKGIKSQTLRRITAIVLALVAVALVLAILFLLLIPQLISTIQSLIPKLQSFFVYIGDRFVGFFDDNPQMMDWISKNTDIEKMDWASIVQQALTMAGNSASAILERAFSAIGTVTSALMNFVISLVFALYCLFQKETLARQGRKLIYAFFPEKFSDETVRILRLTNSTFSNFISGQCVEVCILGAMFAVSMAIFRMPYIPLVSVLIAVTAFIPIIGAWIGCALGTFLILVFNPIQAVWFIIMFVILQQIENNLIYPRVVGTSIGLSGMWVLVAVAVGGKLMGVVGMFLMIPVASVLYTLLREACDKRISARDIDSEKLRSQPLPKNPKKRKEKKEKVKK